MEKRVAILSFADSRDDYFAVREALANQYTEALKFLENHATCYFTPIIRDPRKVKEEMGKVKEFRPQAVILNLPIWADPVMPMEASLETDAPILLLGNTHPATSSLVGLLGAGGAMDQVGRKHFRLLGLENGGEETVRAFVDAAAAADELCGSEMLRFGDSPLGIVTAAPDPLLWLKDFGVKVRQVDEMKIVADAEKVDAERVEVMTKWLEETFASIEFGDGFTPEILEKQVRSYLALKDMAEESGAQIMGIRCQPDLSNGYANQCLAITLINDEVDAFGEKRGVTTSCESDANGALTMHILRLLSGRPASLMDIRQVHEAEGTLLIANCGAIPLSHYQDCCGKCGVRMMRHAFGESCAACCTGERKTGPVTMARLCVKNGRHWMAIVRGESVAMSPEIRAQSPAQFPTAYMKTAPLDGFIETFGSNHMHVVDGDVSERLIWFCKQKNINYKVW
ncbi:MAG: hypothetical protein IJL66_07875 [Lachnospiraceae bacterium]|nr:hypothetical protein [Lachnospiraceae bacterium]